ncbi:MAG TPA: hypothetical protein VGE52_05845, partial [Pirellulales bacterium]
NNRKGGGSDAGRGGGSGTGAIRVIAGGTDVSTNTRIRRFLTIVSSSQGVSRRKYPSTPESISGTVRRSTPSDLLDAASPVRSPRDARLLPSFENYAEADSLMFAARQPT